MKDPLKLIKTINILVTDDMEAIRTLVKASLKTVGANNIDIAYDGESAWKVLSNKKIGLIICDWDMPKMSGLDLLKKIKASSEHKHIPFLLLTATTEKALVMQAVKAGVTDYLSKPFKPSELEYRVVKMLRKVK